MDDLQIKRRVWFICFIFTALFWGLLLFSIFGCTQDKKFDSELTKLESTYHQLALNCAELGYTCAEADIPREKMREMIKGVLDKEKEISSINGVHVYEVLPDGTKQEMVVPPSKGWEVKEKE